MHHALKVIAATQGGLGPELLVNGALDVDATGWTAANAPGLVHGVGGVTITNNGTTYGILYQAIPTVIGRLYRVQLDIDWTGPGAARADFASAAPTTANGVLVNVTSGALEGNKIAYFRAVVALTYFSIGNQNNNNSVNKYGNVSVRRMP